MILTFFVIFWCLYWVVGWVYVWVIGTCDMKAYQRIIGIFILFFSWPLFLIFAYVFAKYHKKQVEEGKNV